MKECAEKAEISGKPAVGASAAPKPAAPAKTSTDGGKKSEAPAKKPAQKQAKPAAESAKPASSGGVCFFFCIICCVMDCIWLNVKQPTSVNGNKL